MLDAAELAVNVLEFRQRAFQFERIVAVGGRPVAVFARTETESESRFRPQLVHLRLVAPQAWLVLDPAGEALRLAPDGRTVPVPLAEPVVEVAAEPAEFREQGIPFRRVRAPSGTLVYAPAALAGELLGPDGLRLLGIA